MPSSLAGEARVSEELARFREAWKDEVRKKMASESTRPEPDPTPFLAPPNASSGDPGAPVRPASTHAAAPRPASDGFPPKPPSAHAPTAPLELDPVLSKAVEVYRRAAQCEQASQLDEALRLYRMAFRMDANVDRAYHKAETQLQHTAGSGDTAAHAARARHGRAASASSGAHADAEELAAGMQAVGISGPAPPVVHAVVPGTLAGLLAGWPRDLAFAPADEREKTPLGMLPDELLVLVLRNLDTIALERFAAVNRKARVVSLDATIWRDFVRTIYKPPQIADDEDVGALLHAYTGDYRRLYIEQPRVRLDGIYIAVCHYIRAGLGENAWINVSHLITYHRYLRFYPDGQVLSLLANEEMAPQHVISVLKPTLRMKGLVIGTWQLDGTAVHITDLLDPSGDALRYAFEMTLELRSRPLGRWNRLDLRAYASVDIATGEATPLGLKHERPFWFSRVRSYA